jgi:hypothetical protein
LWVFGQLPESSGEEVAMIIRTPSALDVSLISIYIE